MDLERMVADLAHKIEQRFYGKYRGLVVSNADPEQLGRLQLKVPSILGKEVVTGWAMPCVPYGGDANEGLLFIPEKGAGVWVEFEEGDLEFPIWVGAYWSKPGGQSELPKPNRADGTEQFSVQDPVTRKIIKTKKGHTLQFEDQAGEEMILIKEGHHQHVITLNKDGIKITDGIHGHEIVLGSDGITITDQKNSGNEFIMDSQGILCKDKNGNTLTMNATSGFLSKPGIDLNGGKRICLEGLVDWLISHKHIGNLGAPTPLSPDNIAELIKAQSLPDSGILSDTVKAK